MKNSLGNPARGEAFYDRNKELKKIYRVLNANTNVYLAAPRRVGKTSILRKLEAEPKQGYCFIYVITESVDDSNNYFKVLFDEILKSDAIKARQQVSQGLRSAVTTLLNNVESIHEIKLRDVSERDYYESLISLLTHLKAEYEHLIVMVDEFPQTIQNILDRSGQQAAETFLQRNRELRQHNNLLDKVNFILTGSVSLFPMVEKVSELTSINDIRTLQLEPLSDTEARDFLLRLSEDEDIDFQTEQLDYILKRVQWLIPFHLQLIQQEILDVYESDEEQPLNNSMIDKAFDQIVHSRNKPQFEPYFSRLKKIFSNNEYELVLNILTEIASDHIIGDAELANLGVKHHVTGTRNIMEQLEADGYLVNNDAQYLYTSPILKSWCKKHICK